MDRKPTPGQCPHCKTALNPGATACTGCGAFETTAWDQLGVWKNSLLIGCFLLSPLVGLLVGLILPSPSGVVVWIGLMVGYFVYRAKAKKTLVWAVGGRRLI